MFKKIIKIHIIDVRQGSKRCKSSTDAAFFAQSREAKTKIVSGATFTISIAQEVMDPVIEVEDE